MLKSGKSQTMVRVPKPVTAKGDGAQRTPQVWQVTLVPPGRVTGMPTSALGAAHAAGISPAPAQGTNLSPASPPAQAAAPAPHSMQTPPGREPKSACRPERQVSHKDTTPAPTRTAPILGSPAATRTALAEAVLQAQSIPVTARLCRAPACIPPAVRQPCPCRTPSSRHRRAAAGGTRPSRAAAFQAKPRSGRPCCSRAPREARTWQAGGMALCSEAHSVCTGPQPAPP